MPSFKDKLAKFVEAEAAAGIDADLLNQLHEFLADETLYWDLPAERRNTFNAFFREIHSLLDSELMTGRFGASIVIDSIIVSAFEAGYRLGLSEKQPDSDLIDDKDVKRKTGK